MKKILSIAISSFSISCIAALFSACNIVKDHIHNYDEWNITSPATCETAGERTRTCAECGDVQTGQIQAPGHNWDNGTEVVEATCDGSGLTIFKCMRTDCGQTAIETVLPLGHEWDDGTVTKKATCEDNGVTTYKCKRDGKHSRTETIKASGHEWREVEVIKYPTCEEDGLRSAVCGKCDAKQNEQVIPALEHNWQIVKNQDETCLSGGVYSYSCLRENCNTTKTVTTDPIDHIWDNGITVNPDCVNEGSITRSCTFGCGEKKIDKIQPLGHQWGAWETKSEPDCTTKGSEAHCCTRTNCFGSETREVAELGHSWSSGYVIDKEPSTTENGIKSKHCTRTGCTERTDVQTIPKLDAAEKINYKVTITDPCGDRYNGSATIEVYSGGAPVSRTQMSAGGVTEVSLDANNYKVKLTDLSEGYFTLKNEYDVFGYDPNLTICLGAAVIEENNIDARYELGSIIHNYEFSYFDPNGESKTSSFKSILEDKRGILLNFYFTGCSPCRNEMPALVSASNTNIDDVQVLMINYRNYGDTDTAIKSFQSSMAANSPLWFVNVSSSTTIFNCFSKLATAFPTTIMIDCNGQVVYSRVGTLSEYGFNSQIRTSILNRYDILHPDTQTEFTKCEVILPSNKFYNI